MPHERVNGHEGKILMSLGPHRQTINREQHMRLDTHTFIYIYIYMIKRDIFNYMYNLNIRNKKYIICLVLFYV